MKEDGRLARAVSRLTPGWHAINGALCGIGFLLAIGEAHVVWLGAVLLAGACFSLWAALTSHRISRG